MSIQQLQIQGFRSLHDVSWEPGNINVVIGPNGSGKSNLLRAMHLLKDSATGGLPDQILRAGGISPLLWDGKDNRIRWQVKTHDRDRDATRQALTYELVLQQIGASSSYRIEYELLGNYYRVDRGERSEPMKFLERHPGHAVTFDVDQHKLVAHENSVPEDQTFLSLIAGPLATNPVVNSFRDHLKHWSIYHDIHVDPDAELRKATVSRVETRLDIDGRNLIRVLHTRYTNDRDFKYTVDSAMRAAFGRDFEELVFPPAADQQVQLRVRWRSLKTEQSAAALSDGTIRFLVLLAIFGNPQPGDVIAVDEPETGLHPSMFPIVAELAVAAAERTQVILTTHSPEFLDAFRSEEPPTTTVAQWIDGKTQLSVVDGKELSRWLAEYSLGSLQRSGELENLVL